MFTCYICSNEIKEYVYDSEGKPLPCSVCMGAIVECYYDTVDLEKMSDDEILEQTELYIPDEYT